MSQGRGNPKDDSDEPQSLDSSILYYVPSYTKNKKKVVRFEDEEEEELPPRFYDYEDIRIIFMREHPFYGHFGERVFQQKNHRSYSVRGGG